MKQHDIKHFGLFIAILSIYLIFFIFQPIVDYSSNTLYDGKQYLKIAEYFAGTTNEYLVNFPFNTRIGVPFIVSFFPSSLVGFTVINMISLFSFYALLNYFFMRYIKATFIQTAAVLLWLSLHFAGPLRYYIHDPMSIDLPIMVLEGLVVLAYLKKKPLLLFIAAVCGIFIKESMIPLLVLLLISSLIFHKKTLLKLLLFTLILSLIHISEPTRRS